LGLRMPRVSPQDATEFMDEFMEAMHAQFPKLVIQHEDFATDRAFEVCNLSFFTFQNTFALTLLRLVVSFEVSIQIPDV
jgi:hypothetical protein